MYNINITINKKCKRVHYRIYKKEKNNMTQYTTLTQFIDEQCTKLDLPKNEKTLIKIRAKFTRTLKELGIWDKAETKIIDRSRTKVFTNKELYKLHKAVTPYLLKLLPEHDRLEIEQTQQKNIEILNRSMEAYNLEEYERYLHEPPMPSENEINRLMLEALFLKFFEPINFNQWSEDLLTLDKIDFHDIDSVTDPVNIKAQNRLNNKVKAYVRERKD